MATKQFVQESFTNRFRPGPYLDTYYKGLEAEEIFFIKSYHTVFGSGLLTGKKSVLDIGSGPSPITVMSASRFINDITMSDFVDENCQELEKWVNRKEGAHDFGYMFKYVAKLENQKNHLVLEARVRAAIQRVIHGDVLKSNPIAPYKCCFDVLTCSITMEYASADLRSYRRSFRNISSLLNPGGFLLMTSCFGNTYYYVGEERFHALPVTRPIVESALRGAGLEPILWSILPRGDDVKHTDFTDSFFVAAYKMDGKCPFRIMASANMPNMEVTKWCQGCGQSFDYQQPRRPTTRRTIGSGVSSTILQGRAPRRRSARRAKSAVAPYSVKSRRRRRTRASRTSAATYLDVTLEADADQGSPAMAETEEVDVVEPHHSRDQQHYMMTRSTRKSVGHPSYYSTVSALRNDAPEVDIFAASFARVDSCPPCTDDDDDVYNDEDLDFTPQSQ